MASAMLAVGSHVGSAAILQHCFRRAESHAANSPAAKPAPRVRGKLYAGLRQSAAERLRKARAPLNPPRRLLRLAKYAEVNYSGLQPLNPRFIFSDAISLADTCGHDYREILALVFIYHFLK